VNVGVPSSVEGAGVITELGTRVGDSVDEGAVLLVVSGRPVFALAGPSPAYRTLAPGMSGDDVLQLQNALARLGYEPDRNGEFGQATKDAVAAWYAASGFEPVWSDVSPAEVLAAKQTLDEAEAALGSAEISLADVSGTESETLAAQQAVNDAQRTLDDALASKDEAITNAQIAVANAQAAYDRVKNEPSSSPGDVESAYAELVEAQTQYTAAGRRGDYAVGSAADALAVAKARLKEVKAADAVEAARISVANAGTARDAAADAYLAAVVESGPTVALGEVVFVSTLPARVRSSVGVLGPIDSNGGDNANGDGESNGWLVRLASGGLQVATSVRSGDEGLVRVGMPVVMLDETTNSTYKGTVRSISSNTTVDSSGQAGREAVIDPVEPLPDSLAGSNLRVTATAASSDGEVLVVPLAAVSVGADGGARVSVLRSGSTTPVDVEVTAGISADGFVAVQPVGGDTLAAGDFVVVGR
jgi:hypothetical protein